MMLRVSSYVGRNSLGIFSNTSRTDKGPAAHSTSMTHNSSFTRAGMENADPSEDRTSLIDFSIA